MNTADELLKLENLHRSGALSDEEFTRAKARLLAETPAGPPPDAATLERRGREWGMFLHLSVLLGLIVPIAGLVVPIVLWQIRKDELPGVDAHGRNVMDWIISLLIYAVVGSLLILVVIGIPLLMALGVVAIVFPIIAAVRANNGVIWKYPMTIRFFG